MQGYIEHIVLYIDEQDYMDGRWLDGFSDFFDDRSSIHIRIKDVPADALLFDHVHSWRARGVHVTFEPLGERAANLLRVLKLE